MKKLVGRNTRLIRRAVWLIRHRSYAVAGVIILYVLAKLLILNINFLGCFLIVIVLVVENVFLFLHIKKVKYIRDNDKQYKRIKRNINLQISADLIILSFLVHFSGGIESPFVAAYFFHMVISSILLSQKETFLQTTFAVILLTAVSFLEHKGIISHYCVCFSSVESPMSELYRDTFTCIRILSAFIISFYILAYLSSAIGKRLRDQEEHYTEAIKLLNRKDKIKNEYVLRITHDIKGHIAAIQSSLSIVKSGIFGQPNPKNLEFIERAYKRTKALIKFIKDLLRLTKMRQGEIFDKKLFFFKNMLYECIEDARPNADKKSIQLNALIDENIGMLKGEELSLKEITTNMILNAVKYTPIKGKITLSAYDFTDYIRVVISDNGIGVPEEDKELIFTEFYRGTNVDIQKIEGTGVGLAIAKNVISYHNGTIWVENKPEGGSSFYYDIPKDS